MTTQEAIIAGALAKAWPGKQWTFDLSKGDYSGLTWMDAEPKPTAAEFDAAVTSFTKADPSDIDTHGKTLRALGLLIAQYTGKSPATVRSDFMAVYRSL
jgi:hypothetical protein